MFCCFIPDILFSSFIQNAYEVLKAKVVRLVNEFERKFLECERRYYLEGPLSEQMDWNEVMELQEVSS